MHPQQLGIGGGLVRQRQGKNHKVDRHQADRLPQVYFRMNNIMSSVYSLYKQQGHRLISLHYFAD